MQITHVKLSHIGRFCDPTTVRLDGSLIAIVGPNEAGKSTLLRALASLNDDAPIAQGVATRDVASPQPEITAFFELEDSDRQALSGIPGGIEVTRCSFVKTANGLTVTMEPTPGHDLALRNELPGVVDTARTNKILQRDSRDKRKQYEDSKLTRLRKWGGSPEVPLPDAFFTELAELVASITQSINGEASESQAKEELKSLIDWLQQLSTHERDTPARLCEKILLKRRPSFLLFSEGERSLESRYDLQRVSGSAPNPLRNLAELAQLPLHETAAADSDGNRPRVRTLVDRASEVLAEVFSDRWVRADVVPVLDVDNGDLQIHVRTPGGDELSRFDERSDGFRWFVALVAFILSNRKSPSRPILLIDEAETHLSYDAQANLTTTLSDQDLAQLVLYTTHSAGCLPPDLGTGIRVVVPEERGERSGVRNGYWTDGPGYTPLMLAMGADALAFTPARRVVVGEGPSESILLPTLLREATGRSALDFQIAPGLSNVSTAHIRDVMTMAGEVAYLLDGDEAGEKRRRWLTANGFARSKIVSYSDLTRVRGITLEDLVAPEVLADAINLYIKRWHQVPRTVDPGDLPDTGRMPWVKEWCSDVGIDPPAKPQLAQMIVDMRNERPLTWGRRRALLANLADQLDEVLRSE